MKKKPIKKIIPYSLRLTDEMREALEDFAERNEMQVSDAIRLAVRRMLEDKNFKVE